MSLDSPHPHQIVRPPIQQWLVGYNDEGETARVRLIWDNRAPLVAVTATDVTIPAGSRLKMETSGDREDVKL